MCRTQYVLTLVALCVGLAHSWDIVLSKGDLLEFYEDAAKKTTVRLENQNLAALAYDEVHNMILYVDKQSHGDAVCGYDILSMENKCFTERHGRIIQGLAFDPATELCFFSDTRERSINWFSLKSVSNNNVNVNVLIKLYNAIPTDIAVDICRGYIYWINTGLTTPTIERARLDGSERQVVIYPTSLYINTTYTVEPYNIAIDQQTQLVYWMEPETSLVHYIYTSDLNGNNKVQQYGYIDFGNVVTYSIQPNSLTVTEKSLYLVDEYENGFARNLSKINNSSSFEFYEPAFRMHNKGPVGIAANYKVSEQIQGISECKKLTGMVRNLQYRIASSLCDNYCIQGKCSLSDEGLPVCRCNAGYSGGRCEVYACHGYCHNNGTCSLDEEEKPNCQCGATYEGSRCETVVQQW